MRKTAKKQMLEILQSLKEALQYMNRAPENACRMMAENCRMCTKTIADALDAEKQAEQDALAALTRFDQTLDASLPFLAKRERWLFKLSALQKQLMDVKKKIKEIKTKLEVVFLPYKASMWDSLESIWRAADADPDCDAYVVPIPYYDRKHDGTFGEMHYEGDKYPDYVSVVDWRNYDVESRNSDIIFIHNPYDDGNIVTSVHPAFYSKRLRDCTDMLVYLPYFVEPGETLEHFCITAGCVYSHKTILQSESVRDSYIRAFQTAFGNRFGSPKDKFVALGSPKFDKVINAKREDYILPKELKGLLVGRKVILYNTSIGAALQNSDQYLSKLQNVLEVFRKRNDVVLWWRPHPLLENTFSSMRQDLANAYKKVVGKYCGEAYEIYDDEFNKRSTYGKRYKNLIYDGSSDLHRAITWTDAYYGDWSSLVALYQIAGKPIIIQDNKVRTCTNKEKSNIQRE